MSLSIKILSFLLSILCFETDGSFVSSSLHTCSPEISRSFLSGGRIDINENFNGIEMIHADPDVFIIRNFLEERHCSDIIDKAQGEKLKQSPVAYAGKTEDVKELTTLSAKGPVLWLSLAISWFKFNADSSFDQVELFMDVAQNYAVILLLTAIGIDFFIQTKEKDLQNYRTSTSTTLQDVNDTSSGTYQFLNQSIQLFNSSNNDSPAQVAKYFEAPTVIRYESGQSLSPHYDANRSAEIEDIHRGGQTLATLLLYLNNVNEGGLTSFGCLRMMGNKKEVLTVKPRAGDALLFFPADKNGNFDDRLEHEGCPAMDTKWVARIWKHHDRVPPPFGLSISALSQLDQKNKNSYY